MPAKRKPAPKKAVPKKAAPEPEKDVAKTPPVKSPGRTRDSDNDSEEE